MPHPGIEPEKQNSVCMERNSSTPIPLGHIAVDIRSFISCTVLVNRTSWLRENNDEKNAFLKQNNFMRIDEFPYHSSLFYK